MAGWKATMGAALGCLVTAMSVGCGGDESNNPQPDLGTPDTGAPVDLGTDLGSSADLGVDAGPQPMPISLRVAHFGAGATFGPIHVCATDGTGSLLLTTDALVTGDFLNPTTPTPILPGTVTRHFMVPAGALPLLAGRTLEIYRAAEAGADIQTVGTTNIAVCMPGSATPLGSVPLGTGANQLDVNSGKSVTLAVLGGSGAPYDTACAGSACPGPQTVIIEDQRAHSGDASTALTRVVLADARYGAAPGICHDLYMNPSPNLLPVVTAGIAPYGGGTGGYTNVAPIAGVNMGDAGVVPQMFTLHVAGTSGSPCTVITMLPDGGTPTFDGVVPIGPMPNPVLIGAYAALAAQGAATVVPALAPNTVTTVFVAPFYLRFENAGGACNPVGDPTCVPAGMCTDPTTQACNWTALALPVDDTF